MANIYTWTFPTLQVYTEHEGETDVVYMVHWHYDAIEESGSLRGGVFGVERITPYASGSPFVPFNDLTQEIVQGWVEDMMGPERIASYQTELDGQIEFQKSPPIAMLVPPWLSTPTPTITPTPSFTPSPTATPVTPTPTRTEGVPVVTNSLPMPPVWPPTPTPTPVI